MRTHKKLFKHGGSLAVVLPAEFTRRTQTDEVILEMSTTSEGEAMLTITAQAKSEVKTMEEDPLFALFIQALGVDAMQNPKKLKTSKEVWGKRAEKLLKGVLDGDNK